jgi:colanic acid/amylovoran biosynthesis protein
MNILIINLHSSRNAGDDVLTRVTVDLLSRNFPQARLTLAMNDPESYQGKGKTVHSFMTFLKRPGAPNKNLFASIWYLWLSLMTVLLFRFSSKKFSGWASQSQKELLEAYFEADLVVSSAGNFLYSSGKFGIAFLIAIYTNVFAWIAGKPLYMMPQTIGPLNRRWERWLVRWLIRRMRVVFVRDAVTRDLLQSMGVWHERCRLVPDVAFHFKGRKEPMKELESFGYDIPSLNRPLMGVTLINWQAQNRLFTKQDVYETAVSNTIRAFIEKTNGTAILFSQVCGPTLAEDDRVAARRVYKSLADLGNHVIQIDNVLPSDLLKSAYGLMDIFMGTRLHSNIFAMSEGTPAIMIQYQYKTLGIAQMLSLSHWVIDINEISSEKLTQKLFELWDQKKDVHQQICLSMAKINEEIEQIGQSIVKDVQTL